MCAEFNDTGWQKRFDSFGGCCCCCPWKYCNMNRVNFEREGDCAFSERMFRSSQVISMIIYRYANTNTTNGLLCCQQFAFSHHRFVFIFDLILFLFLSLKASIFCCCFFCLTDFLAFKKMKYFTLIKCIGVFWKKRPQNARHYMKKAIYQTGKSNSNIFRKYYHRGKSCDAIKSIHIYSARWHTSL